MLFEMDGISRIVGWRSKRLALLPRAFPAGGRHGEAWTLAKVMLGMNWGSCLTTGGLCESVSFVELRSMSRVAFSVSNTKILSYEISVTVGVVATVDSLRGVFW